MKKNFFVLVTDKLSEQIQKLAFERGWSWDGSRVIQQMDRRNITPSKEYMFLCFDVGSKTISYEDHSSFLRDRLDAGRAECINAFDIISNPKEYFGGIEVKEYRWVCKEFGSEELSITLGYHTIDQKNHTSLIFIEPILSTERSRYV